MPQKTEEQRPLIVLEDRVVCVDSNCVKADVCEILKSVMRLDCIIKNMQKDYGVEINLKASIMNCKHLQSKNDGIIEV